MTIDDARNSRIPSCSGIDRCDRLKPLMDREYSDTQASEEIVKTCRECGKFRAEQ